MFHEFRACRWHGMLSSVTYPLVWLRVSRRPGISSSTRSQVQRDVGAGAGPCWAHYARHFQTDEPLPSALLAKVLAAAKVRPGVQDHGIPGRGAARPVLVPESGPDQAPPPSKVMDFEKGAPAAGPMSIWHRCLPRYHSPYFMHVVRRRLRTRPITPTCGAKVLARDTESWFHRHGGLSRANGDLLSGQGCCHAAAPRIRDRCSRKFLRAALPTIGPLLQHRGFAGPCIMPPP